MTTLEEEYRAHGFTEEWMKRAAKELQNLTTNEIGKYCPYLHWKEFYAVIKCVHETYVYDNYSIQNAPH